MDQILIKYSPLARRVIHDLEAIACSRVQAMAKFAEVLEHGGVFGSPISNDRWLFLTCEPPEDRIGIDPEYLSPAWNAAVVNEAKNWRVVFFFDDRAVALELLEAILANGDVDTTLNGDSRIVGMNAGPWR